MKVKYYFTNVTRYKMTGLFNFYILPSLAIYKDDIFKDEQLFEICFQWLCWAITISVDKKENI